MVKRQTEPWRPPLLARPRGGWQHIAFALRRFLDLQVGSIWNDLRPDLASAQGPVLDVGCGSQLLRALLPPQAEYCGIDTADCKTDFGYEVPDTVYFDGVKWPIADGWAQTVLITETLEHVFEHVQFLAEACRCTRPGGKLLLTVPFAARWHFIPHDYYRYTPSCLERLLRQAGFAQIEIYARGNAVTVACYKVMALVLPLLAAPASTPLRTFSRRLFGLLLSPLLLLCALVGNISLRQAGGDDCLGYTVTARRPGDAEPAATVNPDGS